MKTKNNLVLFIIIALVVGFLIGYLVFGSGVSSTGNAKLAMNSKYPVLNKHSFIVDKDNNTIIVSKEYDDAHDTAMSMCCQYIGKEAGESTVLDNGDVITPCDGGSCGTDMHSKK